MTNLQEILHQHLRDNNPYYTNDPTTLLNASAKAQAAIAELVEGALPDIKVGTKNLPLNDIERGYNVAVEDIRNNLKAKGLL